MKVLKTLQSKMDMPALPRTIPFFTFLAFIAVEELARALRGWQLIAFEDGDLYWLYPPKAVLTGLILALLWKHYVEITWRDLLAVRHTIISCACGALVFLLWIKMDWAFGTSVPPQGFNPSVFEDGVLRFIMVAFRIGGAVLIVPVMEELFWRSFLIRYIIAKDFTKVPVGQFTAASFVIIVVFFGLEHSYFLAGMMAGVFFNGLLYYTKSIAHCILAHAVANLCLAQYVLVTGYWHFW